MGVLQQYNRKYVGAAKRFYGKVKEVVLDDVIDNLPQKVYAEITGAAKKARAGIYELVGKFHDYSGKIKKGFEKLRKKLPKGNFPEKLEEIFDKVYREVSEGVDGLYRRIKTGIYSGPDGFYKTVSRASGGFPRKFGAYRPPVL